MMLVWADANLPPGLPLFKGGGRRDEHESSEMVGTRASTAPKEARREAAAGMLGCGGGARVTDSRSDDNHIRVSVRSENETVTAEAPMTDTLRALVAKWRTEAAEGRRLLPQTYDPVGYQRLSATILRAERDADELEAMEAALPAEGESPQAEKTHEWAASNCHMLARREIRRLESWRKDGGETTPVGMAVTAWQHVIRVCERAGVTGNGILREPAEGDSPWHASTRSTASPPSTATASARSASTVLARHGRR